MKWIKNLSSRPYTLFTDQILLIIWIIKRSSENTYFIFKKLFQKKFVLIFFRHNGWKKDNRGLVDLFSRLRIIGRNGNKRAKYRLRNICLGSLNFLHIFRLNILEHFICRKMWFIYWFSKLLSLSANSCQNDSQLIIFIKLYYP